MVPRWMACCGWHEFVVVTVEIRQDAIVLAKVVLWLDFGPLIGVGVKCLHSRFPGEEGHYGFPVIIPFFGILENHCLM